MSEPRTDVEGRLEAWAGCVRRLMEVAPTATVKRETGIRGGNSTPPERKAIREEALRTVDRWLARDIAAIRTAVESQEAEVNRE